MNFNRAAVSLILDMSSFQMLGVTLKSHVFSDHHVRIPIGWAHILDLVWVVSSDVKVIGRVTHLANMGKCPANRNVLR